MDCLTMGHQMNMSLELSLMSLVLSDTQKSSGHSSKSSGLKLSVNRWPKFPCHSSLLQWHLFLSLHLLCHGVEWSRVSSTQPDGGGKWTKSWFMNRSTQYWCEPKVGCDPTASQVGLKTVMRGNHHNRQSFKWCIWSSTLYEERSSHGKSIHRLLGCDKCLGWLARHLEEASLKDQEQGGMKEKL